MSDKQRDYWKQYIKALASALGLLQWRIRLLDDPADDGLMASCQVVRGRRVACLKLASDWLEYDAEQQRHAIIHELLHVWIEPVLITVEAASEAMKHATFKVLYHNTDMQSEYAIDGIAAAIAPFYPLPEAA
jgi:hypothetical protein